MRALLPLLLLASPAAAQDVTPAAMTPAPPATPPDPAAEQVSTGTNGLRLTVPVSVAGAGPFPFLIDTGSQRTVISRELAQTLGLLPGRSVRVTAMTGVAPSNTVVIPSITVSPGAIAGTGDLSAIAGTKDSSAIAGRGIEAPAFAAADLGAPGLLGIDTLQDRRVSIDLDNRLMSVLPSSRRRRRSVQDPVGEIVVQARSRFGQLIVTDAYAGGVPVRVILDTGSVASIGNLALRRKLGASKAPSHRISLTSVTGESIFADYTILPRVKIGDLSIEALPVAYVDAAPFRQLGLIDKPAILLGMDAIALFRRVEIDFPNREVRLLLPRDLAAERARQDRRFPGG